MKILHVIYGLPMAGAEKLIVDFAPKLVSLGHEVDVFIFDGVETPFYHALKDSGIIIMKSGKGHPFFYDLRNIPNLIKVIGKYDIIHTHTTPAQLFVAIAKMLCRAKAKLVTTEHSTNNHRRGKWYFKILDKWMYNRYQHIICISETSKLNLEKQIGKKNNISVIENGIDVETFHKAKPVSRESLGCKDSDFVMTMVARFCDAKDQNTIIRALKHLPEDCKLVLVGSGDLQSACEKVAIEEKVNDRVKFVGIRKDVPAVLHASDVIIMSSHWEGLSLSSVEGMSVDKPFIASDVEGLREVVGGAGLLFKEGDSEELATIITKLRTDNEFYQKVAKQCYERALKYDISTLVREYNQIYQNLLK
ncbi:MAG: glycosyltransferase [Bacteroidaceae bacterium]|nr:glycosyltransferase [Bacteroidaceae bacterium]